MLEHGFDVHPIADGKFHRFKPPGDRRKNGWCVFHGDHGSFGNWKTGLSVPWSIRGQLSDDERRELDRKIKAFRRRHAREIKAGHELVAKEAASIWQAATPCIGHSYLTNKRVLSHGLKVHGANLLVPMYDNGKLWSLQQIPPDGIKKRNLPGGKVRGCYYPIGPPGKRLWLAEGYATAATLHEVTGDAVACCFSADNLANVAQTLRIKLPDTRIIVGADNDQTGRSSALRAAAVAGGVSVYPEFDPGDPGSDWNDFATTYGVKFTREALHGRG